MALHNLATVDWAEGRDEYGRARFESALAMLREVGDRATEALTLGSLASSFIRVGRLDAARERLCEVMRILEHLDAPREGIYAIDVVAELMVASGRMTEAARLLGAGSAARIAFEVPHLPYERAEVEKLERRHPHVFGDEPSLPAADQNRLWEQRKVEERRRAGGAGSGFLAGVPEALPALSRALKLQKRAAAAGFDWRTLPPVLAKLDEEIAELRQVLAEADADAARVEEEVGDLLFSTVNAARHAGVDPETALRRANRKFAVRFGMVEAELAARGKRPEQATLEEMDSIWQSLKS